MEPEDVGGINKWIGLLVVNKTPEGTSIGLVTAADACWVYIKDSNGHIWRMAWRVFEAIPFARAYDSSAQISPDNVNVPALLRDRELENEANLLKRVMAARWAA